MECEEGLKVLYALHKGEVQVEMHGGGHGPVQQEGLGPDGRPGGLWGKEKLLTSRRGDFIYRMLYRMFLFSLLGKFCHFSGCAGKGADKTKVLSKKKHWPFHL